MDWARSINDWLPIVLFIGLAATFLRGSRDKGTIESQDRQITALKGELAMTNGKLQHVETENTTLKQRVTFLEDFKANTQQIEALQEVTAKVLDAVVQHNELLMAHRGEAKEGIRTLHEDLTALRNGIKRNGH